LLKRRSYEALHYAIFSALLLFHPFSFLILSSASGSQASTVYVLFLMSRDQVSYSYKNTGKIVVLPIFINTFFDNTGEDKSFSTEE
jgi:hypothetical protein